MCSVRTVVDISDMLLYMDSRVRVGCVGYVTVN